VRTSRPKMRADDQHQTHDFDADASEDERDARGGRGKQSEGGDDESPAGEQKEKSKKFQAKRH